MVSDAKPQNWNYTLQSYLHLLLYTPPSYLYLGYTLNPAYSLLCHPTYILGTPSILPTPYVHFTMMPNTATWMAKYHQNWSILTTYWSAWLTPFVSISEPAWLSLSSLCVKEGQHFLPLTDGRILTKSKPRAGNTINLPLPCSMWNSHAQFATPILSKFPHNWQLLPQLLTLNMYWSLFTLSTR